MMTAADLRLLCDAKSNLRLTFLFDGLMQMIVIRAHKILKACCGTMLGKCQRAFRMLMDRQRFEVQGLAPGNQRELHESDWSVTECGTHPSFVQARVKACANALKKVN